MSDPTRPWLRREGLALLTDLYQLTMLQGYLKEGKAQQRARFDYFFRALPSNTGFALTAGLEDFLSYLEHLRFTDEDIRYLRSLSLFDESFFQVLAQFQPACTVRAMPEGTVAFPYEPILSVEGGLFEVQLLETALLNMLNFQTLIATKAARISYAAEGEPVMEFGLRRAHGPDGGLSGSRAAYIGGCSSTSNVLAGKAYGIPVAGTQAHSWIMSFESELEAFRSFVRLYPQHCTLLVDTYDTLRSGVPNAIQVFQEMKKQGRPVRASIRLDSGELAHLSKAAFEMLAAAGFDDAVMVGSNDLDEYAIADLKRHGAKINAWGVGTRLITAFDAPALGGVYKLAAIETEAGWQPRMKHTGNPEKTTDPGRKQVLRYYDAARRPVADIICLEGENLPLQGPITCRQRSNPAEAATVEAASAQPLLQPVFEAGKAISKTPLADLRAFAAAQVEALQPAHRKLHDPESYPVYLSDELGKLKLDLMASASLHERKAEQ